MSSVYQQRIVLKQLLARFATTISSMIVMFAGIQGVAYAQESPEISIHFVAPGDTWLAIARQYGIQDKALWQTNQLLNIQRRPAIGTDVSVSTSEPQLNTQGRMIYAAGIGLLEISARRHLNPWNLALQNEAKSPYWPLFDRTIFVPEEGSIPRELPNGFASLDFSAIPLQPGQAFGFKAELHRAVTATASLADVQFTISQLDDKLVGLAGTGAFFPPGVHELAIDVGGSPSWTQPMFFRPGDWVYEQIMLSGSAAAIDQESIVEEWDRLSIIWSAITPEIMWKNSFHLPLDDFLEFSSLYGAYRSYNGGPYRSYHEGVDFSAYGGTPVLAPASGTVALAENLYVRGGAVLIDHGFGVFSGLYHLSEVLVQPGENVEAGQFIGHVGSTGLSTGNHLHWDLIVGGQQVDGRSWLELKLGCWLLQGLDLACEDQEAS